MDCPDCTAKDAAIAELTARLNKCHQDLADRKTIERAKGIVQAHRQCTENEAHRWLQKESTTANLKLIEVARRLVDAAQAAERLGRD